MNVFGEEVNFAGAPHWVEAFLDTVAAEQGCTTAQLCEDIVLGRALQLVHARRVGDEALKRIASVH
jgi:hypothetical protein